MAGDHPVKSDLKHLRRSSPLSLKQMQEGGWELGGRTGSGHIKLVHPKGGMVTVGTTPRCYHADKNNRAQMRRIEAQHEQR